MPYLRKNWKTVLGYALWAAGLAMLVYGAVFSAHLVLDKPISTEAAREGVKVKVYTEADLTSAVSTDKIERAEDGWLRTVPGAGFCAS
jgi:hypothetical protein